MTPLYLARGASKVRLSARPDSFYCIFFPPGFVVYSLRRRRDFARPDAQVLRRITAETSVELKILSEKWQLLLAGIVFQVPISLQSPLIDKDKLARWRILSIW
jgi:hypothetical protein